MVEFEADNPDITMKTIIIPLFKTPVKLLFTFDEVAFKSSN